ncbi:galactokinase [Paenibacillus swuensis]|uniref:Galactokinase n=1 Tax=Paenibacillus swuensis TaxID=1178515 RepID=A0A172TJA5_9BACL|nr:galactokinase [Paenibacillus swuensis]ANE46984.1 galactokinase [Paenibacillus swuensis]
MADIQLLTDKFTEIFKGDAQGVRVFNAPGRVNLIGEHTDYNGGYVFPAALTFGTTMLIRKRDDKEIHFASTNFPATVTVNADEIVYDEAHDWTNYPKGVIKHLQNRGFTFGGYDVLFHGEIPNGAGLSSSASLEVVTGYGFMAMENHGIDTVALALVSQEAENQFVGVNCGIMDQFAVANGRENHAILLMCDTLEYSLVPFDSKAYKIVIGNTNKRRGLVDSAYNERRAQCEKAVEYLQGAFPEVTLLGQLTLNQFNEHKHLIPDEVVKKRAQHVVEEIDRVLKSVEALKGGDLERFGQLMNGSHDSLRDLYEVTGHELDSLVAATRTVPGVLGSRMTGAGFGGCTVSLVHEDHVEEFIETVGEKYTEATGLKADFYVCTIGDGVKEMEREV